MSIYRQVLRAVSMGDFKASFKDSFEASFKSQFFKAMFLRLVSRASFKGQRQCLKGHFSRGKGFQSQSIKEASFF